MSIGSEETSSNSIQVQPGPATAGPSPSADPSGHIIRTPTPPPTKQKTVDQPPSQQQQTQQQQESPKQQPTPAQTKDVTATANPKSPTTAQVAAPAPGTASAPPPRPPPPASAVSLHDAAAKAAAAAAAKNAAGGGPTNAAAPSAPKQPVAPAQPSQSQASTNGKDDASGSAKKPPKAKTPKAPGTSKPKQKRKANQAGIQDELVYRPSPSTAGGTIGATPDASIPAALTAAGGGRKALPELVLPFQLPYVDIRPEMPMLDNASVQAAMAMGASETSSPDTGSDSDDYSVISDESDLDSEAEENRREARRRRREPATIEESLVLLQSLRQSRLSHLSSLLTPFSQRVRSGMIYPNVLPLSLLHGLNPRDPHILIPLGRADIHVGPHVFMKTKFWEVRPDYELPPAMNPVARMRAPGAFGAPAGYSHMGPSAPLTQQLPQPQHPQLPSPRAPLAVPAVPQPKVSLAQPPTASAKSVAARPAPAAAQPSTSGTAATPAATGQTTTKPTPASTATTMPTPTLPATPVTTSAGVRPPVATRPPVTASSAAPVTASQAPTASTTATTASPALPAAAKSGSAAPAASSPASSKQSAGTTVTATPATPATGTTTAAATEAKAVATVPAPVTLAPKPITTPVSLPRPPITTPSLPRPPSISQNNNASIANSSGATASAVGTATAAGTPTLPKAPVQPTNPATKPGSPSASAGPAAPSPAAPATAATSATPSTACSPAPAAALAASKPATPATNTATQTPVRPAGPPPPPAIDAVLVSRVNATAALNPELQELLHIAASGKANPNQLKALGVWIQAITNQLRQDEARNAAAANNAAGPSGSRPGNAGATADGKKTKKNKVDEAAKASKKQAKIEEREAKKKAKAEAKAKAQADKQMAQKQQKEKQQLVQQQLHQQHQPQPSNKLRHPPPGWPTDGPPKPPVIIVEFRENPSMRFILPLWKCLVERTEGTERPPAPKIKKERRSFFDNDSDDEESQRIEPELKLGFFAPSLGSDAADGSGLRELEEELKRKAAEEAKLNAANAPSNAAQGNATGNGAGGTGSTAAEVAAPTTDKSEEAAAAGKKKKGSGAAGNKKGNKAVKQEPLDMDLSSDYQSKKHEVYPLTWAIEGGVTESLWEAFGRVPGTMTCQPVKREPEIELEPDVAEFLVPEIRYHLLDLPMEEIKIQKETTDTFVDLFSHMPDRRFILPRVAPALLPQGLEDHLQDRFAVRPQCVQGRPIVKRKAGAREDDVSFSYEGIGLTVIGPNGVKTEPGAAPPKPPKRKRHVATHNPDGSIKSCGACGKTKTPMWRRGPKGPSQLCNACGARWKAGRLVVPDVAPPPIIEPEEDKSKEEEARKEDEANASMHGSNALVIPQSTSVDSGSFNVMASSGVGGGPAPFGDQLFSLASDGKNGVDFGSPHLSRGSGSPSPFIRSPIPEDDVMPASVDPSMLSGSIRASSGRR